MQTSTVSAKSFRGDPVAASILGQPFVPVAGKFLSFISCARSSSTFVPVAVLPILGLPVRLLHYGLLAVLSFTIVATLKAVGLILAIGLLISPGAIAFLITRTFSQMLTAAIAMSVIGPNGFFVCLGVVHGVICVFALYRMTQRPAPPLEEQTACAPITARASAVATALAMRKVRDYRDWDLAKHIKRM